jgi:phage gp37-like protein
MYNVDQNTPELIAKSADQLAVALVNLIVAVQTYGGEGLDSAINNAIENAQTVLVDNTNYTVPE